MPKGANIEWGGLSFKAVADYDDFDSDSEDEAEKKDTSFVFVVFTDDLSSVEFAHGRHYKIYANPENLRDGTVFPQSYEVIPSVAVYDSQKVAHKFAIVCQ
ncbi:unnamed protein product [Ambrosiozyma monospora]|uniref:Unnamed protein product n=1 Tax=Ambrosiozyma monospora TaxID=43982 RepID=A0ACB5TKX4_AMBMO|nr:unnamed protein product [Ambrosiozyma monospora]